MKYHTQWVSLLSRKSVEKQNQRELIRMYMRREITESHYEKQLAPIEYEISKIQSEMDEISPFLIKENKGEL